MQYKRKEKAGLTPGAVVFTGNRKVEKTRIHYIQYNSNELNQQVFEDHKDVILYHSPEDKIDWYDMRGIHDTQFIELFGDKFNIHPLILEDIADVHQRPKFEEYEKGIFITLKALSFDKKLKQVITEQVAIYFMKGFVATFQETESDLFQSVRSRVTGSKGKIRHRGADYLAYAIVDEIVDNYFVLFEEIDDYIESLEENLMDNQDISGKVKIHDLKKELLTIRKSVIPLREAISRFTKSDSLFVSSENTVFTRDLYDHTIQIMEMVESFRDRINSLQDLFNTEVNFKMNQVMQLLTLIATLFIPLTFLAGIYGMNFKYMPELHWKYSYYVLLGIMTIIFIGLLTYFKRKKWF